MNFMEVNTSEENNKFNVNSHERIMAFDQHHSTDLGLLASPKHQTIFNEGSTRLPQSSLFPHFLSDSLQSEESPQYNTPWQAQEDPYQLSYCAQRMPSSVKSVWSPHSVKDDIQQYFQSESNIPAVSSELLKYPDPLSRGQRQFQNTDFQQEAEFHQAFSDLNISDQWLLCPNSSDTDRCSVQVQDVQTMSSGNCFLPKTTPGTFDSSGAVHDDSSNSINLLFDHRNRMSPSGSLVNKTNDHFLSFYSDYSNQNKPKPNGSKQVMMQEAEDTYINNHSEDHDQYTLFSRTQSLESQKGQFKKEVLAEFEEPRTSDHAFKVPTPPSTYFSGISQQETENFLQMRSSAAINLLATFQSKHLIENTNNSSANFNQCVHQHLSQYQNQARKPENSGVPDCCKRPSFSMSDFFPQNLQQMQRNPSCLQDYSLGDSQKRYSRAAQNQVMLNLEELRKAGDNSEFDRDLHDCPLAGSRVKMVHSPESIKENIKPEISYHGERSKKQEFIQNAYLDILGNVRGSHGSNGRSANIMEKSQLAPIFPNMHLEGGRQNPWQWNSGCYSPRSTFPSCNFYVHPVHPCNLLPDNELSKLNPCSCHMMSTENPLPAASSKMGFASLTKNRCGPTSQLHNYLKECYEQWRSLEKERKEIESILTKCFPGKKISIWSCSLNPKVPQNSTRVDRLIVHQLRERARVVAVVEKMECLRGIPLHANIHSALDRHLEVIHITQTRSAVERINTSNRMRQGGPHSRDDGAGCRSKGAEHDYEEDAHCSLVCSTDDVANS